MVAKTAEEILGFEFDWLAQDADGHIGLFSTAGGGYTPAEVLEDTAAYDTAIDALLALPAFTVARFAPQLPPGRENTWRLVAERGCFAFDSDPSGGPYCLVAAPESPIKITELSEPAATAIKMIVASHIKFAEVSEIAKELLQAR